MSKNILPTIFVSSTCYDLAQIRADLRQFIESIGYEPLLSEFESFPVNPSLNTISNCLEIVKQRADIFVLVIGGRYGSITDAGLSITNQEFIEANSKNIPTYVFVNKEILTLLPIWQSNPYGDFSKAVDSPKLFEFVNSLRDKGYVWVFPFTSAEDIKTLLKKQLSYLISECLAIRTKLNPQDVTVQALGPTALKVFLEKPKGWEYLVFALCISDFIQSHESKQFDVEIGISFGNISHLNSFSEILNWLQSKNYKLENISKQIVNALNIGVSQAVGAHGEPGNLKRIVHIANRFGQGYLEILEWNLEFRRVVVPKDFENLMVIASSLSLSILSEIRTYAQSLFDKINDSIKLNNLDKQFSFILEIPAPDMKEFEAELERLEEKDKELLRKLEEEEMNRAFEN